MKTFSLSMLAVTGLALSLAACGPGIKGEGTKKPNVARLLKIQEKAEAKELANYPHIKSIALGESDDNEVLVKVELENVGADLDEAQKSVDGLVAIKGEALSEVDVVKGKANTYKIKLICIEECTMIAGVLDVEAIAVEATEVVEAAEETKKEEVKEEESEELFSAQSGTTAPEAKPSVAIAQNSIRTGIIVSATGEVMKMKVLDSSSTVEASIEALLSDVAQKKSLGLIK